MDEYRHEDLLMNPNFHKITEARIMVFGKGRNTLTVTEVSNGFSVFDAGRQSTTYYECDGHNLKLQGGDNCQEYRLAVIIFTDQNQL